MTQEEIIERVRTFIDIEQHSTTPIPLTPENIARLCHITPSEAENALNEFQGRVHKLINHFH